MSGRRWPSPLRSSGCGRFAGRLGLLLLPAAALTFGCARVAGPSSYRVTMPVLQAKPGAVACRHDGLIDTCTVLLTRDYEALVRELKAACLALGGSPKDCQATD